VLRAGRSSARRSKLNAIRKVDAFETRITVFVDQFHGLADSRVYMSMYFDRRRFGRDHSMIW